jgi:hypothetical protein
MQGRYGSSGTRLVLRYAAPTLLEETVIILGIVLLLLGLLLKMSILTTIGVIVLVVGLVLLLLGSTGRAVGGRKHFF